MVIIIDYGYSLENVGFVNSMRDLRRHDHNVNGWDAACHSC